VKTAGESRKIVFHDAFFAIETIEQTRSSGRPAEHAPTEQVKMDVKNRLARVFVAVEDKTIAFLRYAKAPRDLTGGKDKASHKRGMPFLNVVRRGDMLAGDDEDVNGGLGADIPKGDQIGCLENNVRGDFAGGDAAEETVFYRGHGELLLEVRSVKCERGK